MNIGLDSKKLGKLALGAKHGDSSNHTALVKYEHNRRGERQDVTRPVYSHGKLQPKTLRDTVSAWDEMMVCKYYPGQFNAQYVAGMNVTNLPTTTFSVSNAFTQAVTPGGNYLNSLGDTSFTLLMWCPSMTAFTGEDAYGKISASNKLGGFAITKVSSSSLDTGFISKEIFKDAYTGLTMTDVYGSDMTGFSAGGFVWSAEMELNILCPRANLVGSYYQGTIQFG